MFRSIGILIAISFWTTLEIKAQFSDIPWEIYFQQYISSKKNKEDYAGHVLTHAHQSKTTGVTHLYFRQEFQGQVVQNATLSIHIDKEGNIIRANDHFIQNIQQEVVFPEKTLGIRKILEKFWMESGFTDLKDWKIVSSGDRKSQKTVIDTKGYFYGDATAERVIFCREKDACTVAWEIEYESLDGNEIKRAWVDTRDGRILDSKNLVINCSFDHAEHDLQNKLFTPAAKFIDSFQEYIVYPLKTESPNHGNRMVQQWVCDSLSSPYDWHDTNGLPGHDFTSTKGNNVEAREDIDGNNSTPGQLADGGDSLIFNFQILQDSHPHINQNAAISNLFYWNNILHDIFYRYGFDEASGNFQSNNYGHGGLSNDAVMAQAMDGGGLNNANFYTPVDGSQPRMQMYLWSGPKLMEVLSPPNVAGIYEFAAAAFGSSTFHVSQSMVLVNDGSSTPTLGCNPPVNSAQLNGKIAVIDRGGCEFGQKCLHAQNAGAVAVIICNNVASAPFVMGSGTLGHLVTIPSIMVGKTNCDSLKVYLNNLVNVNIIVGQPVDGDYDDAIICHEYGHGITNRLTGGAGENNCLSNQEQMGEGWSDWFGLMLTMEEDDIEGRARGMGTYVKNQSISGPGIRPYKYSTDMNINPHTYQSIVTAVIPHGIGAVWCAMLWEMTWAFIREYGYDPDLYAGNGGNNKVIALVVEALKLQPCNPGFTDGRDAILLADSLLYGGQNSCLIWKSFAKRGLGYSASQGNPNNRSDGLEAFDMPPSCCLYVSNTFNEGNGSFRQAISCAENGDTITFLNFLFGDTIRLEGLPIEIDKNISVINKHDNVTIQSMGDFPAFITQGAVNMENFTIHAGTGGEVRALSNEGSLHLKNMRIVDAFLGQNNGSSLINTGVLQIEGGLDMRDH